MRSLARTCAVVGSLTFIACTGTVSSGTQGDSPDAALAAPDGGDAAPATGAIDVTGTTTDYFSAVALANVALATDGVSPAITSTSGADGSYTIANVPPASVFFVSASADPNNYRPTVNDSITVVAASLSMTPLYAVSKVDTQRQYSSLGLAPTAGTAMLVIDLLLADGTSLEGVAPTGITLVDSTGTAVTGTRGPFFFGANGDLVPLATTGTSTKYNGSARAAFLDVPPGSWTVNVTYTPAGTTTPATMTVPVTTLADGATLTSTGKPAATTTTSTGLTFTKDIYPMLQRAAQGGQGCANCHNAVMLAGGLPYDGTAADTYTKIMAAPGVVVAATPATSLLLSMPLYENPPDMHPNATWLTNTDPAYVKILAWITAGAKQ